MWRQSHVFIAGKTVYKHTILLHVPDKKNPNEGILDKPICTCSIELYSFIKKNRHQVAETITLLKQLV